VTASLAARLGLGTAPLAGLFRPVDDAAARDTIDRAWSMGIRHFDTAPLYGSGLGEHRLGEALRGRPRDQFTISTKVGRLLRPGPPDPSFPGAPALSPVFNFSRDGLRRSLEESLERLQLDRIDVAFVHDPDDHLDQAIEAVGGLTGLGAELGVGTNQVETAIQFVRRTAIQHVLIAGRYTLLDRTAAHELLPLCAERGIRVTAGGVFNSGLLAGGTTFDYRPAPPDAAARASQLGFACGRYAVPLPAVALQFSLRHPAISTVLIGPRSAEEVNQDFSWLRHPIPDSLWSEPDFCP
jgi:D-threo-aldose 1-dehydrogenase